ncbi:DUF3500 domain-containing protein [Fulvivirga ulvae]|uniref:DUF3500 domain-containing protein n=1 Tax=Fulvivirga ulvae TaxID=2904245 RepID=UPI001F387EB8|nr:DUF3500 domain-containing protein [Fulvivirga ulvae]UII35053.1 DUF3500 domain-containing protein [Fulvivirga ulvae]
MKKLIRIFTLVVGVVCCFAIGLLTSCGDDDDVSEASSVTISGFSPTSGAVGTVVTITGTNFSSTASDNTVSFNGTAAQVDAAASTQLTVAVPAGATTGTITVTVNGEAATSDDDFTVTTESSTACDDATTAGEKVVCLANNFIASLSSTQASTVQLDFTAANAAKWSNLPGGVSIRNGLEFSELSAAQLVLAKAVIEAASGSEDNQGYDEFLAVNAADDYLGDQGGGGTYSSGEYIIAFLGTPSTSGTWMLQFGGHHYAQNITFEDGVIVGPSPSHQGVEPLEWTADGTSYAPLNDEQEVMAAMLAGLSTSELSSAKISGTYSDVVLGPGSDGEFPETKVGLAVSGLTTAQKALVLDAIEAWVGDIEDEAAEAMMAIYESELDETYIGYSGNASLTNHADYVRIDGPSVWIEFICQNGVVLSGIHYHTIYRDHTRDYGGNF